jgi:subtilisin family serine protease
MRTILQTVLAGVLAAGTVSAGSLSNSLVQALESNPSGTQRIIVKMKDAPGAESHMVAATMDRSTRLEAMKQNASLAQASLLGEIQNMGISGDAKVESNWLTNSLILNATPEQIRGLEERGDVERIYINKTIQLAPFVASEVTPGKFAQGDDEVSTWGIKATRTLEAREAFGVDGSGVVVGILDTGFDASHRLLSGKILRWKSFDGGNQPDPVDDNGHGSHCAGTIGGSSGGGMEIGMAPGVKFVAGKIFTGGGGATTEGILGAMEWVVDPDGIPNSGDEPRLVSNSWGGGMDDQDSPFWTATKAWRDLDIAPIFAAGNEGPGASTVGSPGGYPEAFAVGATTVNTTMASFSSRGPVSWNGSNIIKPDISAPGKDVTSVKAGGEYWTISGTSMATPHVAGIAALLYQANPSLTVEQLIDVLQSTSIDEGPEGKDNDWGHGHIDTYAALAIVANGGKVAGSVVGPDGTAIPYAKLIVDQTGVQVHLKADGSFRMLLPEGDYSFTASAFGFQETAVGGVTVVKDQETAVQVSMQTAETGAVMGRLTGSGAPVQGKIVVVDTPLAPIQSDSEGNFSLELPAGSYSLAASAYGFSLGLTEIQVVAGQSNGVNFNLEKLPPVLVVDDDAGKSYENFYTAALTDFGFELVPYGELEASLNANFLAQYEVVVWLTGNDYNSTLTTADQEALKGYVDIGGRLFVSGQEIGYALKNTAFYHNYMGADFVADAAGSRQVSGMGLSFKIEGGDGANNQRYPDAIKANDLSQTYLSYSDNTGAAVRMEKGNGKVVYFGFGFEGIDTAANRSLVMDRVMGFLKPTAAEMAARLDALSSLAPADPAEAEDQARLVQALATMISTRVQEEGIDLPASSSRILRRVGAFGALGN